ncbi:hypothetical protein HII31_06680 [Pseudocercospora fuligena]|uniref:DUF7605 domain-containing protein n=1 Tax=Pseudocercospora fuligena TaxID=685502 RepID=A0A8H6VME2_9PEZI|nr:hypothetical protein HII31_06680 [Pseudocercospora fuligena]
MEAFDLSKSIDVKQENHSQRLAGSSPHQQSHEETLFVSDVEDEDYDDLEEINADEFLQSTFYNENTEALPSAATYDKDFAQIPKDIKNLLTDVQSAISEERKEHPRYKHMFNEADRLKEFPSTKKLRINIVGKSGSGKSSLLNSVLGRPDAAKALAAGKGCTHVPTAYESSFPKQTTACAAEVVFFSESEIRRKFELMLQNYCIWHFEEHDWPMEEEQTLEDAAQTAFDAFRSLFCEKDEFATAEAGEQFLKSAKEERSDVIDQLMAWCELLLPDYPIQNEDCERTGGSTLSTKRGEDDEGGENQSNEEEGNDGESVDEENDEDADEESEEDDGNEIMIDSEKPPQTKAFEADTQQDIRELVESYAFSSSVYKKASLWPLVKTVRIGLKGIRVLDYVVLVDWPGADDTNQLRANASADRIYDCDELWIVSSAARICSEPTVMGMLARYGGTIPCSVICTQIDANRDDELAAEMKRQGYDTKRHDGLLAEEKSLQKLVIGTHAKLEGFRSVERNGFIKVIAGGTKRQRCDPDRIRREIARFDRELSDYSQRLTNVEQLRLEAIVQVRQQYVRFELSTRLEKHSKEGAMLKLFFASNEHYMAHKGAKKVHGPVLSPEATGIPALREHLLVIAAPHTLNAFRAYIDHKVAVLLEGIAIVVDPGELERCQNAVKMVVQKKDRLPEWQHYYLQQARCQVHEHFVTPIMDRLQALQAAALKVLAGKKPWAFSSIRAFVRKDGRHETRSIEWESWNEQFLDDTADIILENWDYFADVNSDNFRRLQEKLLGECRDIVAQMDNTSAQYRLDRERFTEFIESQLRGIHHLCQDSKAELKKKLGIAKIEATQDDEENPTGYFSLAMQGTWDQCKEYKGTGSKMKILTALETQLKLSEDRSPFALVANSLAKAISDNVEEQTRAVIEGVERVMDDIKVWLDLTLKEEADAPEDLEVRDRLKAYLEKGIPRFNDIRACLKMIERRYETVPQVVVKQE